MVIMGIDPGVANTGFGVIRLAGNTTTALDGGVIEASADLPHEERLKLIHDEIGKLIDWHDPVAVAFEDLYFGRNVRSASAVGQARGVGLLAAAQREISCHDYTPQAVKMAVCGNGAATKEQVQRMVGALLSLAEPPHPDHVADAFAVALCHAGYARPQAIHRSNRIAPPQTQAEAVPRAEAG